MYRWTDGSELYHHGIKGQKWGVRRFQNPDGTLTEAGKARLEKYKRTELKGVNEAYFKRIDKMAKTSGRLNARRNKLLEKGRDTSKIDKRLKDLTDDVANEILDTSYEVTAIKNMTYSDMKKEKRQAITIGAAAVAGSSLATIGLAAYTQMPFFMVFNPDIKGMQRLDRIERVKNRMKSDE